MSRIFAPVHGSDSEDSRRYEFHATVGQPSIPFNTDSRGKGNENGLTEGVLWLEKKDIVAVYTDEASCVCVVRGRERRAQCWGL